MDPFFYFDEDETEPSDEAEPAIESTMVNDTLDNANKSVQNTESYDK